MHTELMCSGERPDSLIAALEAITWGVNESRKPRSMTYWQCANMAHMHMQQLQNDIDLIVMPEDLLRDRLDCGL